MRFIVGTLDGHGRGAHDHPIWLTLWLWVTTPLGARPTTARLHWPFRVNLQRTKAVPFARLASGAVNAPGFGADVPESTACGFVIAVGLQIGGKLVAKAVGRYWLFVLGPQAARQAAYLHGQIDGAPDLREHPWFRLGIQ